MLRCCVGEAWDGWLDGEWEPLRGKVKNMKGSKLNEQVRSWGSLH